mmetsp:Transcript_10056/g.37501  ORF Transcript_10056/g.37501 Transcript_10056/m.37501 type:complete len:239 (-) Transcript_10056:2965-3681(-)
MLMGEVFCITLQKQRKRITSSLIFICFRETSAGLAETHMVIHLFMIYVALLSTFYRLWTERLPHLCCNLETNRLCATIRVTQRFTMLSSIVDSTFVMRSSQHLALIVCCEHFTLSMPRITTDTIPQGVYFESCSTVTHAKQMLSLMPLSILFSTRSIFFLLDLILPSTVFNQKRFCDSLCPPMMTLSKDVMNTEIILCIKFSAMDNHCHETLLSCSIREVSWELSCAKETMMVIVLSL